MKRIIIFLLLSLFCLTPYAQNSHKRSKKTTTTTRKTYRQRNNGMSYSNSSIRGLQGRRAAIRKKIKEQERALKKNEEDVKNRLQNLLTIKGDIDKSQKKIDGIEKDIHHIDGNIGILKSQLRVLENQLKDRKKKYIKSMRYMASHRTVQDKMMFVFSAKSFTQMYRRLRFVHEYAAYQKAQGEMVKMKQAQVLGKHKQLESIKGTKNHLLYKGQLETSNLHSKQDEQQKVVQSLQKQQKTIQKIIVQQRQKDAALNAQIDRMVSQEVTKTHARAAAEAQRKAVASDIAKKRAADLAKKRAAAEAEERENERRVAEAKAREAKLKAEAVAAAKAAEEAREAQAKQKADAEAAAEVREAAARKVKAEQAAREAKAARLAAERKARAEETRNKKELSKAREDAHEEATLSVADRVTNNGFEANKGRLPMPITGTYRVISHYGQYNVEGLSGVTLDNKGINILGTSGCRARAIYNGEVSAVFGFGGTMVVMVRHGAFISVYCNLSSVRVHKGEKVATRQALGDVASDHILQFQLRKETSKLNPETWLGN